MNSTKNDEDVSEVIHFTFKMRHSTCYSAEKDDGANLTDEEARGLAKKEKGDGGVSPMEMDGDSGFHWLKRCVLEGPGEGWTAAV